MSIAICLYSTSQSVADTTESGADPSPSDRDNKDAEKMLVKRSLNSAALMAPILGGKEHESGGEIHGKFRSELQIQVVRDPRI